MNNADRIFDCYFNGQYGQTFKKTDKLRIRDGNIFSCGTRIGYILDEELSEDYYCQMLILTLQNFRSQPSWKTHKKQLAAAANRYGIPVVFVPEIDIGFLDQDSVWSTSTINYNCDYKFTIKNETKPLLKVARYSQDPDIRTACVVAAHIYYTDCVSKNNLEWDEPVAYSYNQLIDGEFVHAEDIITKYVDLAKVLENYDTDVLNYISLLEPCYDCLLSMCEHNAEHIVYNILHKEKWNTPDYIQLTNDIYSKQIKQLANNHIITYTYKD